MADFWDTGDYPGDWSDDQIEFWDSVPGTNRSNYDTQEQYEDAQDVFQVGFMTPGIDPDERDAFREMFYEMANIDEEEFNWDAFREFMEKITP